MIDIEASGFGARSYPIEIGCVRPDGRAYCTLVRPLQHWTHWDAGAERVHGISRETLLRHGRPVDVVAQQLNENLAGLTVYCDAWAHDFPWLATLYEEAGVGPSFRLESATTLLDEALRDRLPLAQREALAALGLSRHRASSDARALQWALQRLVNGD